MDEHIIPAIIFLKKEAKDKPDTKFTIKIEGLNMVAKEDDFKEKLAKILPNKEEMKLVF